MALLTYGFVNFLLYPAILQYQAGTAAGNAISQMVRTGNNPNSPETTAGGSGNAVSGLPLPIREVYTLVEAPANYSFEFYSILPVQNISIDSLPLVVRGGPVVLFLPSGYADTLTAKCYRVKTLQRFPNYHVSQLTGEFLNAGTRVSVLDWYSLVSLRGR